LSATKPEPIDRLRFQQTKGETVWFRPFSVRLIVFRSQHLHIRRTARRKELRRQLSEQILQQRIQILSRPTMASHALSDSAFLDGTDLIMRQNPVSFYYAFAYSHRQHIIFHHYVLTPSISFRLLYLFLH